MQTRAKLAAGLLLAAAGLGAAAVRAGVFRERPAPVAAPGRATLASVGLAAEERALWARAGALATTKPLLTALDADVDTATMVDLLDKEPWWRDVRDEFQVSRVVLGTGVLATHGKPDLEARDRETIDEARRDGVATSLVHVGGDDFALVAARLAARPEQSPVLVLAKRVNVPPGAPRTTVAAPVTTALAREGGPAPLLLAGSALLAALIGVALLLWKRGPARDAVDHAAPELMRSNDEEYDVSVSGHLRLRPPRPAALPAPEVPYAHLRHATSPDGMPVAADGSGGQRFGRYQLLNRIGEGGMSEVFTAVTNGVAGFRRVFVLKRLRPELSRDPGSVAQFVDEARMQASLVHSNIVPVFDFGRVGEVYFMTQEYIVGRDLGRVMAAQYDRHEETVSARVAQYVAHETLMALQYAHTRLDTDGEPLGIVHRDISPGNIILSAEGEVKLADFGIVKSNRRTSQTQVGMVKGNANFMSPEQARGQVVDRRSDLFSVGLVLYFSMTNRLPYDGENDLEVLYKAASGPSPEVWERIDTLPSPAREALGRALALDRAERFQSAAEFAAVLGPHLGGAKNEAARLMKDLFGDALLREAA
jgi:hypothetical protein